MTDRATVVSRIMQKVEFDTNGGCWLWTGAMRKGYGNMCIEQSFFGAHRVSYEIHHGAIPSGMFVMHKCDVRTCVNPSHLMIGTPRDNMRDMVRKGRCRPASESYRRVSEDEIRFSAEAMDRPLLQVSREMGRNPSTVARLRRKRLAALQAEQGAK